MKYSDIHLTCPQCNDELVTLPAAAIPQHRDTEESRQRCLRCDRHFTLVPFPALQASPQAVRAHSLMTEGDASCFFHATNQATAVCDDCGRFLCSVCAVNFAGETLCPSCIAARKDKSARFVTSRITYDSIALWLALLPLLVMFWLTCITAPVALAVAIYGWRRPLSLVRRRRWRFVLAMILSSLQIIAWGVFLIMLFG